MIKVTSPLENPINLMKCYPLNSNPLYCIFNFFTTIFFFCYVVFNFDTLFSHAPLIIVVISIFNTTYIKEKASKLKTKMKIKFQDFLRESFENHIDRPVTNEKSSINYVDEYEGF